MKSTTFIAALAALSSVAVAQPHRHHRHLANHVKRDVVTYVETVYVQATAAPQVIVYVDQNGVPVSTSTERPVTLQTVVKEEPAAPTPDAIPAATPDYEAPAAVPEAPTPVQDNSGSGSTPGVAPGGGNGHGITYSPYNSDGSCKSADAVNTDFNDFGGGYSYVRTYGVDCDTVKNVLSAAKAHGMKLFQGVFDINDLDNALNTIISAVGGSWGDIHTVAIGNELVNGQQFSADQVMAKVSDARQKLRAAGYSGPVVTVDTLVAALNHPQLCDGSDYCAVNSHPFFDPNTSADQAGTFLTSQMGKLRNALANKDQTIVITEAGWPSKGNTNGNAVPSAENQKTAVAAIKGAFSADPSKLVLFNPYNMHWKKSNAAQFNAEPWWGFLGDCPSG